MIGGERFPTKITGGFTVERRQEAKISEFLETWDIEYRYISSTSDHPSFFIIRDAILFAPQDCEKQKFSIKNLYLFVWDILDETLNKEIDTAARFIQQSGENAFVFGFIPYGEDISAVLQNLKEHVSSFCLYPALHSGWKLKTYHYLPWISPDRQLVIATYHTQNAREDGDVSMTLEAYRHARQSRFDHGECGYRKHTNE